MSKSFSEVKLFKVKPSKIDEFVDLIEKIKTKQKKQQGCIDIRYMKRFYVIQEGPLPPRKLTRIVKCIKYYSYWEFDTIENYGIANDWLFKNYYKELAGCLIEPFEINCGYSL